MNHHLKRDGYSVSALRRMAQKRLPRPIFDFIDGGAEDEEELRMQPANIPAYGDHDDSVAAQKKMNLKGTLKACLQTTNRE